MTEMLLQLLTAFTGSFGFALLFNIRGNRLLPASLGGVLAWGTCLLSGIWIPGDPVRFFLSSIVLTFYAELFARIQKTPATIFLVSGAIPLIPGGYLYHTMSYAVNSDWKAFLTEGKDTLVLAVAIAMGMLVAMSVLQCAGKIHGYQKTKKVLAKEQKK